MNRIGPMGCCHLDEMNHDTVRSVRFLKESSPKKNCQFFSERPQEKVSGVALAKANPCVFHLYSDFYRVEI